VLKAKVAKEDSIWVKYFSKIRGVCPWSYKLMDKILVVQTKENCLQTWSSLFRASKYEACVYTFPGATVDWLSTKCDELNSQQTHSEWLWSHPAEGGDSTHIECLIQQSRAKLTKIRESIGYVDED
jgi:hypothetical protein